MALSIYLCDKETYPMDTYEPLKAYYVDIIGPNLATKIEIYSEWRGTFKDENGRFITDIMKIIGVKGKYIPFSKVIYPAQLIPDVPIPARNVHYGMHLELCGGSDYPVETGFD